MVLQNEDINNVIGEMLKPTLCISLAILMWIRNIYNGDNSNEFIIQSRLI